METESWPKLAGRLRKTASVDTDKYQPYAGGAGPINLSNSNPFNGLIRMGTSDLMEDLKFLGGFRISSDLNDYDVMFSFLNQRKRLDWGFTYYRNSKKIVVGTNIGKFVAKEFDYGSA